MQKNKTQILNPHEKSINKKKSTESHHECTDPDTAGYKWFWCISLYLLEK